MSTTFRLVGSLAVFVLAAPAFGQQELFKLSPADGEEGDAFGRSVAISGAFAVAGAWEDDDNGGHAGAAYLFDLTTAQLFKLLPTDGGGNEYFGWSVAISGDRTLIGASQDHDNGPWAGSAYVFDVTTGQQLFELLATDGETLDYFGTSVAIDGDRALVGALRDDDNGDEAGS